MNDEQQLLASAYLDGTATDEEHARAEADPEVMAAVERLGEFRRALSAVDPPDPTRRDVAINAALDAFDVARRPTAPSPASAGAGRRSSTWFLGAAAAAAALVLVVAGGILAIRGDQDGDDDSAGGAAATEAAGTTAVADLAAGGADTTTGTEAAPQARTDSGAGAAPTTAARGTFAAASTTPAPQAERIPSVFTSPEELTAFAAQPGDAQVMASEGTRPPCHQGQWRGSAIYVIDGVNTPVDVFLARAAGEVRAVDPTTCAVLVTAPAP
jgi:hypothetical protein